MAPQPHSPRTQSPLTRGKHPAWILRVIASRLIPAHAGKTLSDRHLHTSHPVHPRSRRENHPHASSVVRIFGSSPLTRGKRSTSRTPTLVRRLIPAHAGKTARSLGVLGRRGAHPRSRGENCAAPQTRSPNSGSSPLTRGKQDGRPVCVAPHGLIPAHAGKTSRCVTSNMLAAAHPRSRGENLVHFAGDVRECGSSPLTRGKRISLSQTRCKKRLIPAHAGKTWKPLTLRSGPGAHPRSRGENVEDAQAGDLVCGSSPLTRGKQRCCEATHSCCRLIPAHAGKTPFPGPQ